MSVQSSASTEYAQFRETFFAECAEMLTDMDAKLERLSSDGLDPEELDAVFRAVHSIKAGAGMFNYAHLVQFAHSFEALLDRMRDGRMLINSVVASLIIRAGDVLAELVSAAQQDRTVDVNIGRDVADDLQALLSGDGLKDTGTAVPTDESALVAQSDTPPLREIRICFTPKAELLRHANEPLLLIRELRSLGALEVLCNADRIPALDAIEIEDIYLSWVFSLTTTYDEAAVREVFEFVEDDAEITMTSSLVSDGEDDGFGLWLDTPIAAVSEASDIATTPSDPSAPPKPSEMKGSDAKASGPSSIRVDLMRVDRLVNMVGELVISQAMLRQELSQISAASSVEGLDALEVLTRELQDCVMAIRMQPVRSVFSRMPRLVREVAGKLNKQVRLEMHGEQTELDKTVIEELSDPLTHMIRNSVDHGIEMPDVRLAAGKPAEGTITLTAAHVGSNILIHIEDDGAGLNRDRLYSKAVDKGVIAAGARLSDDEITDLIFAPGFSTAAVVSDVSGRGVGMDVVRRNIQKIGGRI
ncbi:Chemotaxis protein CheA (plasmid) [Asticcacaulis sp. MM231]|uniref:chemotaxis protein CheA n=1 Tax=Asticcacaulis sp. MM231 TaxID=3157666 RepID=UPI0032D56DA3